MVEWTANYNDLIEAFVSNMPGIKAALKQSNAVPGNVLAGWEATAVGADKLYWYNSSHGGDPAFVAALRSAIIFNKLGYLIGIPQQQPARPPAGALKLYKPKYGSDTIVPAISSSMALIKHKLGHPPESVVGSLVLSGWGDGHEAAVKCVEWSMLQIASGNKRAIDVYRAAIAEAKCEWLLE